jgi:hypothetical protein
MQLSIRNYNFVFDMLVFPTFCEEWSLLFKEIFLSEDFLKLGFGASIDQLEFKRCFHGQEYFWEWNNLLDLQNEISHSLDETSSQKISLSKVCEVLLNAKMDKSETVSNWLKRPLSALQIEYAALDAEVLFSIYDSIRSKT